MKIFRELGVLNTMVYVLDRLLRALFRGHARLHKYYFMAQPVAARPWLPARRGLSLEIRRLASGDPALTAFPRPQAAYPYRFRQGAVCLAAFKAQRPVGFLWFTVAPYMEDEVRCRYVPIPDGQAAWDFDVYVAPELRTGPAFLRLWDEANRLLRSQGVRWSFSRVSAFNPLSVASHSRMGAARVGSVVFATLGGWQLSVASLRPFVYFSRNPASMPEFHLSVETPADAERFAANT